MKNLSTQLLALLIAATASTVAAEQSRFFRILSSLPTAITAVTPNGYVTWTNAHPDLTCTVQTATALAPGDWTDYVHVLVNSYSTTQRLFDPTPPSGMVLIPAGSFNMGDSFSEELLDETPLHRVHVSAFYMDKYEVTKALWDEVTAWATNHGYYPFYNALGKGANHPAYGMVWYGAIIWCNARSEKEGKAPAYYHDAAMTDPYRTVKVFGVDPYVNWSSGYRLPTEAEWEKAARGGASGRRFPWSDADTITHSRANYYADGRYSYEVSPTQGHHPVFNNGVTPYTSPVGYFAPNGYGLHDMAGNLSEWCWDRYGSYTADDQSDPRGPDVGLYRVFRGGGWNGVCTRSRAADRDYYYPTYSGVSYIAIRTVLPLTQ